MEAQVAPRKSIVAPPISLPDEPTPTASQADAPGGNAAVDPAWTMLALRTPASLDAASPGEIAIPVTLRNDGNRAVQLRFGPETLAFDVVGPAGSDHCDWPASVSAPIRDLFTTVVPGARVELTVILAAFCARHALEKAGLLVVRASLDTREASGVDVGLRTFDGQLISSSPTVIRLRHGWLPRPLLRPKLDSLPVESLFLGVDRARLRARRARRPEGRLRAAPA